MSVRNTLRRRAARVITGGGGGGAGITAGLVAGANIGTEGSITIWEAPRYQRLESIGAFTAHGSDDAITVDAQGFPQSTGWSLRLIENQGRGPGPSIKLGTWQVKATPRTPGTPGVWSLRFGVNATLTNYAYDAGTNTVTADLNITAQEAVVAIQATAAVSDIRIVAPGVDVNTTQIYSDEAINYLKNFTTLRMFGPMGLNLNDQSSPKTWEDWLPTNRVHGTFPGWAHPLKLFAELLAANGRCKYLSVNAPPYWGTQNTTDWTNWATYLRDNLPAGGYLLVGGTNETWNSLYVRLHRLAAQVRGYTVAGNGDTFPAMSRVDLVRICEPGKGTAWRMQTQGVHATGATSIVLAAGVSGAEGSMVVGDTFRIQDGAGTTYTVTAGVANVSTGGTVQFSPGISAADSTALGGNIPAGRVLEMNTFERLPRWWALEEARMWKAFKTIFGADWGVKAFGVCQTHIANEYWHESHYLPFLALPEQIAEFGEINTYIHGIGGAPYPTLGLTTYQGCANAAAIISQLRTSSSFDDMSLTRIATQITKWEAIRAQYGIGILAFYESGFEHQGYIPDGLGGFYTHPNIIECVRSPAFRAFCDDLMALYRTYPSLRIIEWLHALPTSYVQGTPNSHWGSIDTNTATSHANGWSLDAAGSVKVAALKAHMQVTGQVP